MNISFSAILQGVISGLIVVAITRAVSNSQRTSQ